MAQPEFAVPLPKRPQNIDRSKRAWPIGFAVAAVVIFVFYSFILPYLVPDVRTFFQHWLPLGTINTALIWAMSALGLNIVVGYAGLLDLGYVAFWALGGYAAAWLMSYFVPVSVISIAGNEAPGTKTGLHLNILLVLIGAAAFCALFGVIIGAPTLRLRSDYLALVTLGFGEIIPQIFKNGDDFFGHNISNGTQSIGPIDSVEGVTVRNGEVGWGDLLAFDHAGRFIIFSLLTALIIFVSLRPAVAYTTSMSSTVSDSAK